MESFNNNVNEMYALLKKFETYTQHDEVGFNIEELHEQATYRYNIFKTLNRDKKFKLKYVIDDDGDYRWVKKDSNDCSELTMPATKECALQDEVDGVEITCNKDHYTVTLTHEADIEDYDLIRFMDLKEYFEETLEETCLYANEREQYLQFAYKQMASKSILNEIVGKESDIYRSYIIDDDEDEDLDCVWYHDLGNKKNIKFDDDTITYKWPKTTQLKLDSKYLLSLNEYLTCGRFQFGMCIGRTRNDVRRHKYYVAHVIFMPNM